MKLTSQHLKAIQKLLQTGTRSTSSKALIHYCRAYGIGNENGNSQHFSARDLEQLNQLFRQHYHGDIRQPFATQHCRFDSDTLDEKLAPAVFASQLIFAAIDPSTKLPHWSADISIHHQGFIPTLAQDYCDPNKIARLIIVENGDMMNHAHRWMPDLPRLWRSALLLYRGHGDNQRHVKTLVQQLPANTPLAIYPDLDPQGIRIAAEYLPRASHIIVPANWQALRGDNPYNRREKYLEQTQRQHSTPSHPILQQLSDHLAQKQLALMQEKHHHLGRLKVLTLRT